MSEQNRKHRIAAIKTADAINDIAGSPISDYARELSLRWSRGEITGDEMKTALLESHKELSAKVIIS